MDSNWHVRLAHLARASPGELGIIAILMVAIIVGGGFIYLQTRQPPPPPMSIEPAGSAETTRPEIVVHVAGLVVNPGVYELPHGSRVKDAIQAAGGAVEGAALDDLNLAAPLTDGQKVHVRAPGAAEGPAPGDAKVDINNANLAQLEELPGVGPVLAQRIIDFRTRKGRFASIRQLLEVEGLGEKKYEALKDLVTV